jgi:broad specificity polyphosphatase/5'/3'-nucleotidase SurE
VLLNINVPNWLRSELKGVREAKLLRAVAHPQVSTMLGGTGSQPADRLSSHPTCDDTDVGLLRRGFITVSSLSPPDRPNPDSILEFSTGLERELAKMAFFSPSVDEGRFDG